LARAATVLAFMVAAALVTMAALMVFGPPVKESRAYIGLLVLVPSVTAGLIAGGMLMLAGARGYRMGFLRGALVGLVSMLVFSSTMASLGCHAENWLECLLSSLTLFGFVMGVPVVVVSALVGMLLEEIFAG
jgi:hypothetical protein